MLAALRRSIKPCRQGSTPTTLLISLVFLCITLLLQDSFAAAADSASSATSPALTLSSKKNVLVLGSAGFIGKYLSQRLVADGYEVMHVHNRDHVDLRIPGSLAAYVGDRPVSFCFFLACEVGGSKFLDSKDGNVQLEIIQHNVAIYQNVLPFLAQRNIPFLFTSSYLQSQATAYGAVKRLGEAWIKALGVGKIVRLWNIYGRERVGLKSHVVTDWVASCLSQHKIACATDGLEARQFLHAQDASRAFVKLMNHYQDIDFVTDISSGDWVTLRTLAEVIREESATSTSTSTTTTSPSSSSSSSSSSTSSDGICPITYTSTKATVRARVPPQQDALLYRDLGWKPSVGLREGIKDIIEFAKKQQTDGESALNTIILSEFIP